MSPTIAAEGVPANISKGSTHRPPLLRRVADSRRRHAGQPHLRGFVDRSLQPIIEEIFMAAAKKDAIALLKADHRKVEELFEKFEKARGADRKKALATEICLELSIHATIEEEIFYPACKGEVEEDLLSEAYVEHDGAKVMIAELLSGSPDDEFYDAKMTVLSEEIKHHVKEEEKPGEGVFAQARDAGIDMDALGERMLARKEQLMKQFEAEGVPAPTTRSFRGHRLQQGHTIEAR
jgi:hypothetical protein